MKKNNIIIIILGLVLIICCVGLGFILSSGKEIDTKGDEDNNLLFTCDADTIKMDEEVVCSLKGKVTDYEVSAVSSTIEENEYFRLIEVIPDSSWEGDGELGDVDLYTDVNKSGTFDVLKFSISLINDDIEEININIVDNSFFDENFEERNLGNITKTLVVEK